VPDTRTFVEIVVWRLDRPARGSIHRFKYRLALVAAQFVSTSYDTEAGVRNQRQAAQGAQVFSRHALASEPRRYIGDGASLDLAASRQAVSSNRSSISRVTTLAWPVFQAAAMARNP